ncbi:hypothetical protein Q0590_25185 [Rhodocytophaga aerolata]|uniref:Transposase n=1 Tax=Rhodocytophaga aerolata TaxID=455078 RepID=A0ABT8RBW3_9BACT|nr:transposase [Rhodocytophaga aerolata]MDO1449596.1 hypothetical protein [Rhodocytophaga aerolata]
MDQRKQYYKEFKEEAVRLASESKNKVGVARHLGINLSSFRPNHQK